MKKKKKIGGKKKKKKKLHLGILFQTTESQRYSSKKSQRNKTSYIYRNNIRITSNVSPETMQARRKLSEIFNLLREKKATTTTNCNCILYKIFH